jgi:beta-lactamase regulating signal transducer with metallopeptidase domain
MIFAARGLLVSLAFFATVYCPLSLLVLFVWRGAKHIGQGTAANTANLLFGLRIFPFVVSAVVTVCFTLPSFWLLERKSPDEDTGTFILAVCSLLILGAGLFRVLKVQARTTRAVTQWLMGATTVGPDGRIPRLRASEGAPPLILVGSWKPRVMISDLATAVLTDDELRVAVRHELEHARSWDNLRRVMVSSTPFPGMNGIESAWQEMAELAADEAAVANRQEALDLAAALIKLSVFSQQWPKSLLATGLVSGSCSISLRVRRLLQWRAAGRHAQRTWCWSLLVLFTIFIGIARNYSATLVLTHRLTELLVP